MILAALSLLAMTIESFAIAVFAPARLTTDSCTAIARESSQIGKLNVLAKVNRRYAIDSVSHAIHLTGIKARAIREA